MLFEAIDHVVFAVPDLASASEPFQRLGFRVPLPPAFAAGAGRSLHFGSENMFRVDLVSTAELNHAASDWVRRAVEARRALCAVGLRVVGMDAVLARMKSLGIPVESRPLAEDCGRLALLPIEDRAAVPLILVECRQSSQNRQREIGAESQHAINVKRLDHLAAVAHDLEEKTRFWTEVLDIPVFGEVVTPTMVIRQFKIGDAIIELLGPNGANSPIHQRPPGLISMISLEVQDLQPAVDFARAAGFNIPDAVAGPLPGTRIATIPAIEFGGIALQLLQYVS